MQMLAFVRQSEFPTKLTVTVMVMVFSHVAEPILIIIS